MNRRQRLVFDAMTAESRKGKRRSYDKGVPRLAEVTGYSERSVKLAIQELTADGFVTMGRKPRPGVSRARYDLHPSGNALGQSDRSPWGNRLGATRPAALGQSPWGKGCPESSSEDPLTYGQRDLLRRPRDGRMTDGGDVAAAGRSALAGTAGNGDLAEAGGAPLVAELVAEVRVNRPGLYRDPVDLQTRIEDSLAYLVAKYGATKDEAARVVRQGFLNSTTAIRKADAFFDIAWAREMKLLPDHPSRLWTAMRRLQVRRVFDVTALVAETEDVIEHAELRPRAADAAWHSAVLYATDDDCDDLVLVVNLADPRVADAIAREVIETSSPGMARWSATSEWQAEHPECIDDLVAFLALGADVSTNNERTTTT